jgi:hypothetical protein
VGGNSGTISDSYATGNVTAGYCFIAYLGGLAGSNFGGTISNCFATGTVTGLGNTSGNCILIGGLIGSSSGTIINCFATGDVNGNYYSYENGGLVGGNGQWSIISNSYSTGAVTGNSCIGGLVGENGGDINQCYSTGASSGNSDVGGLAGRNFYGGNIFNCYSTSNVNGINSANKLGGLVGENGTVDNYYGFIMNCYSTGNVNGGPGSSELGGLVGYNNNYSNISKCYSIGAVTGEVDFGGLVGGNSGTVTASFWDIYTSGLTDSDGGTGKTTAEMKTESTFTNAGWDFVGETANGTEDIWWILENITYPKFNLQRKLPPGSGGGGPGGGDGGIYFPDYNFDNIVNFLDFAIFADAWLTENPFISLDNDNDVDINDLKIFCDYWLKYSPQ